MSFDTEKSYPKIPSAGPEVGIWHETKKRELEATVLSEIHSLGKKFTKKEIQTLLAHVETAQSVDGLRNSLTQKENAVLSDDIIRELLGLAGRIRELAQWDIQELRTTLKIDPYDAGWTLKPGVFLSDRLSFLSGLEEELGKNIFKDSLGIVVGTLDSVGLLVRVLFELIKDLVLLPRDIYESLFVRYSEGSVSGLKK